MVELPHFEKPEYPKRPKRSAVRGLRRTVTRYYMCRDNGSPRNWWGLPRHTLRDIVYDGYWLDPWPSIGAMATD